MKIIKPIVFKNYSFSRASTATYYNASGVLVTAAVNELRLGYNPTDLTYLGAVIEPQLLNQWTYTNDFSNAVWEKSSLTLTPNAAVSPDGTNNAWLITDSGLESWFMRRYPDAPGIYCMSIYVKKGTPSVSGFSTVRLSLGGATGVFVLDADDPHVLGTGSIQSLQGGWLRLSIVQYVAGGGSAVIAYDAGDHYFFGAQLEITSSALGLRATSYIPAGADYETREADVMSPPPNLYSSNVPENDHPVWSELGSYVEGSQVIVLGDYHRVYESVSDNTDKFPPDNPADWVDQGATNRWRMFDMLVGSERQTVASELDNNLLVSVSIDQRVNSVVLLNVETASATVVMRDALGNIVYTFYKEFLSGISEPSWYEFYFGGRTRIDALALTDLPPVWPATIELLLTGGDAPAKIGKMIVGAAVDIGCTRYGSSVGILDFSRKERDDFGNNFILQRRYVDRAEFDIQMHTEQVDSVKKLLADYRAIPAVYVGDETLNSTVIFGFYRDFSIVISGKKRSDATLQIEGI